MGVTIRDIARELKLSSATVSRALNNREDPFISAATSQRVREAAKVMGYIPNRLARALVNGKTFTIGVLGIPLISEFHGSLVCGIEQECAERGYHTLLVGSHYCTGRSVEWAVDLLLQHRVDGAVVSTWAAFDAQEIITALKSRSTVGMPVVWVDERSGEAEFDCVYTDDLAGARQAVEFLVRAGHRRIAHLAGEANLSTAADRAAGYRSGLEATGLPVDESLVLVVGYNCDAGVLRTGIEAMMTSGSPPTALFACNDYVAAEAISLLRALEFRVPEDVAVIGYGDEQFGRFLGLTTVRQNPDTMGARAARRLFERIDDPDLPRETILLPTELVERVTSGRGPGSEVTRLTGDTSSVRGEAGRR